MTDHPLPDDSSARADPGDEAIERIAAALREPVMFDDEFTARVMRSVRESRAAAAAPRSWWRRGYTLHVTPLAGLALAAGLALVAVLGRASVAGPTPGPQPVSSASSKAAAADTVYLVRFALVNHDARKVSLVGDFNGWATGATPLVGDGVNGVWTVSVSMPPGRHEYAFIVDGKRWVSDPFAAAVNDEFGPRSSVLRVGDAGDASTGSSPVT